MSGDVGGPYQALPIQSKSLILLCIEDSRFSGGRAQKIGRTGHLRVVPIPRGGPYRARTGHLRVANAALYQMS